MTNQEDDRATIVTDLRFNGYRSHAPFRALTEMVAPQGLCLDANTKFGELPLASYFKVVFKEYEAVKYPQAVYIKVSKREAILVLCDNENFIRTRYSFSPDYLVYPLQAVVQLAPSTPTMEINDEKADQSVSKESPRLY
jgi:hypothetical protein